jgi:hypothetical protein
LSIKKVLGSLNLGSIRGFLMSLYHGVGRGRKPYDAVFMLKAQLLKHLLRVPSDRRLALLLKRSARAKTIGSLMFLIFWQILLCFPSAF